MLLSSGFAVLFGVQQPDKSILEEGWEDVSGISRFCGEAYSWNGNFSDFYFPISDRAREILGGRDLPYFLNFSVTFFGFLGDFFWISL